MESSDCALRSRKGRSQNKLKKQNNFNSSNAWNLNRSMHFCRSNGIIEDNNGTSDKVMRYPRKSRTEMLEYSFTSNSWPDTTNDVTSSKQCNYETRNKHYKDLDVILCRPCSVVLERVSEKEIQNFLANNLQKQGTHSKYQSKPTSSTKKRRQCVRTHYARLVKSDTTKQRSSKVVYPENRNTMKSKNCSHKIIEFNVDSYLSYSNERIDQPGLSSNVEKISSNYSYENRAARRYAYSSTFQIEELNENDEISSEDSECEVPVQKRFKLSLNKRTVTRKDCTTCRQYPLINVSRMESSEQLKCTQHSENSETTLSSLKQLEFMAKKKVVDSDTTKPCMQELHSETPRIEGNKLNLTNSRSEVLLHRHTKLSLGKRTTNKRDGKARKGDLPSKFMGVQDSVKNFENYNASGSNYPKPLIKRKLSNSKDDEASIHELRKHVEIQDSPSTDYSQAKEIDSIFYKSNSSRQTDQRDAVESLRVIGDRKNKGIVSSKVRSIIPIVKNVKVLLVKIDDVLNPGTFKQNKNVKNLNDCANIHKPVCDSQRKISNIEPNYLGSGSPNKTRNMKITDYFLKINQNSSIVLENNCKKFNHAINDSVLKEKYGICKDINVLLIDYKKLKNHSSVRSIQDSSGYNLFVNSGIPRSSKEKELLNNREHVTLIDTDLHCKNSCNLKAKSQSSSTDVSKFENRSSDLETNTTMPKSSKTFTTHMRELALSPGKHIHLTNEETELDGLQMHARDIISGSLKVNQIREKSNAISGTKLPGVLSDSNVLCREPTDTSVLDEIRSTVTHKSNTMPAIVPVRKSSAEVGNLRTSLKQKGSRRLPVNSMTFLSCEMIEANYSWIELNDTIDSVIDTRVSTAKDHTVEKNENLEIFPLDDIGKSKRRTASNTTKNVENNSSKNSNILTTMKEMVNAKLSKDKSLSTKGTHEDLSSLKLLASKSEEYLSPKDAAYGNIESSSSEATTLTKSDTVQEEVYDTQCCESVSEMKSSLSNMPSVELFPLVEDSIDPIFNEDIDEKREKSNSQEVPPTDLQQKNRLLTVLDESDTDGQSAEDTSSATLSSNCTNSNITLQDEGTSKNKAASPGKECILCNKICSNVKGLEQHLKVHLKQIKDSCHICDKPLNKRNAVEHYLGHSGCLKDIQMRLHLCSICKIKFRRKSSLNRHLKFKHKVEKKCPRSKIKLINPNSNKGSVSELVWKSDEELIACMYKHMSNELRDALESAQTKIKPHSSTSSICQNQIEDVIEKEKAQDKEQVLSESIEKIDALPMSSRAYSNSIMSICSCHKDERLEISGGEIIEIVLACIQCKTIFKSKKCFKNHYKKTSCKSVDQTLVVPKLFCNKCCVILNNLIQMHVHLTEHGDVSVGMKTSLFCKYCNIFFFGIGSLSYRHWSKHLNNPLFLADHYSFPNNMKVKIIEPGGSNSTYEDEPTESLFIAAYQCKKCDKPFQIEEEFKEHLNLSISCSENDTINPKPFFKLICSICLKEFVDKSTFDIHIEEHNTIKDLLKGIESLDISLENQMSCNICQTKYGTIVDYKDHLIRHEVIQEKFVCNYCTLMMDSLEDFARHSVEHKGTPEKPVACKVIFATAKFHCKPCKIWFDDQSTLDEHLAKHTNPVISSSQSVQNLTTKMVPANEKKKHVCTMCQQEFDDQFKLDVHISTHNTDSSDHSMVEPFVIHLSDHSYSADIEVIPIKPDEKIKEPVKNNISLQKQQNTVNAQTTKKPVFLRVKNLKELLPYACGKCKAEFDTQINLINHVCKKVNLICRICKNYQCDNNFDLNAHLLSHSKLQSSEEFHATSFYVTKMLGEEQVLQCKVCPNYKSLTIHGMRKHFMNTHPNIYRPTFQCRVCHNFKTSIVREIRRHEASHFHRPPLIQSLSNSNTDLSCAQNVKKFNNCKQSVATPPVTSLSNNISTIQLLENVNNSQQPNSVPPLINLSNNSTSLQPVVFSNNCQQRDQNPSVRSSDSNLPSIQPHTNFTNSHESNNDYKNCQPSILIPPTTVSDGNCPSFQPAENSQKFQQPVSIPSVTSSVINLSTLQALQNVTNFQQSLAIPLVTNSSSTLPLFQSVDNSSNFQQTLWIPPVSNAGNNLPALAPLHTLTNSQQPLLISQQNSNSNSLQRSISIPSVTISGSNPSSLQPADSLNKFQQQILIPCVTSSGNNLPLIQPLQNTNKSQQLEAMLKSNDNSNNFQHSISIPSVSGLSSNSSSFRTMDNSQWLATTPQTFQIQINNAPPLNNMTNVMHTLPLYVTHTPHVVYCCQICKNFKCSSQQELKEHEALHEFFQFGEHSKRYQC